MRLKNEMFDLLKSVKYSGGCHNLLFKIDRFFQTLLCDCDCIYSMSLKAKIKRIRVILWAQDLKRITIQSITY